MVKEIGIDGGIGICGTAEKEKRIDSEHDFAFEIPTSDGRIQWILSAPTEYERKMWIQQIKQAVWEPVFLFEADRESNKS
jgi:hypothetical protein